MATQKWAIYFLLLIIGFFIFMIANIINHQVYGGKQINIRISQNY